MGRRKQPPEYFVARQAVNQHLHRHHAGATAEGMLGKRLDLHEELHRLGKRLGIPIDHVHEPVDDGENDAELAQRLLREGEDQHGRDASADQGTTQTVAGGAPKRRR